MLLSEIASFLDMKRNGSFNITMFPNSDIPQSICYASNKKTIGIINSNNNISAVITLPQLMEFVNPEKGLVVSKFPARLYYELHNKLVEENYFNIVTETFISNSATISSSAYIGKNVVINENVEISANVQILDNTIIDANTFIGPNVVIGTIGMQNLKVEGVKFNVLYAGGVKIGKRCEILSNAIIQRPYQPFFTTIGDATQVSVKVSVGHGSKIGNNCMIAGNGTIAGNVCIGDNLWMGPSVTIADGLKIGSNVKIMLGSVVANDVNDNMVVSGNFAIDHKKQLKNYAQIRKL